MAIPKVTPTQAELDSTKRGGKHRPDKDAHKHKHGGKHHHKKHHGTWNDKHWRWVPTEDGDWRVQGYIFHHKHKPPKHHFRGPGPKPPVRTKTSTAAAAARRRSRRANSARRAPTAAPSASPRRTAC